MEGNRQSVNRLFAYGALVAVGITLLAALCGTMVLRELLRALGATAPLNGSPDDLLNRALPVLLLLLVAPSLTTLFICYRLCRNPLYGGMSARDEILSFSRLREDVSFEGVTLTENGRFVEVNPRFLNIIGYRRDELIGREVTDFIVPEDRELVRCRMGAGEEGLYESRMLRRDGSVVHVETRSRHVVEGGRRVRVTVIHDITDSKQTLNSLSASESRYRNLFDSAPASLWEEDIGALRIELARLRSAGVTDIRGYLDDHPEFVASAVGWVRIVDVNEATLQMYRARSKEELFGAMAQVVTPESFITLKEILIAIFTGKSYFCAESFNRRVDGEIMTIVLRIVIPPEEDSRANLIVGIVDITEQKRAEEALRESRERYQDLVHLLPQTVFEADMNADLAFINEAATQVFGYTAEDLRQGLNILNLIVPADRVRARGNLSRVFSGERVSVAGNEYRVRKKDGTIAIVLIYAAPMVRFGAVTGLRGIVVDITDYKETEVALQQSEARFRGLIELAPDAILLGSPEGEIIGANESALTMTGYRRDELLGMNISRLFSESEHRRQPLRYDLLKQGLVVRNERILSRKGGAGTVPIEMHTKMMPDGTYQAFIRDITERKEIEETLRRATDAADAANRAKSEFLANMSHEIRTPLTAVIGFSELLLLSDDPRECRKYAAMIRASGENLMGMLNDILDLAKIESEPLELEKSVFCLGDLMERCSAAEAEIARNRGLIFTTVIDPELPRYFFGDPERLRQLLANLVSNAVKFTPQGAIDVAVGRDVEIEADGDRTAGGPGTMPLHFTVSDTGIGIPEAMHDRIFDSFVQADGTIARTYGGSGLGTTIVKRLTELMGGRVWLENGSGGGTVFHVVLPLAIAAVPDAAPSSPPVIPAVIAGLRGKERLRILVAEDNAFTQQLMMLTFRHYGHEAVVAGSGGEVLELWDKGAFDVILMDIRMPGMSGLEVSQEIRKEEQVRGGHIPIIALSANAFMSDREQSLAAGMDFFLAKPLSVAALLGMIHGEPPQVPVPADGDGNLPDNASGLAALFRRGDLPEILCHDGEELRTYVTLLLHDLERAIAGIETALAAGDRTGLARTVHALKGTAGHLQNRNFARLAAELERSVSATALEQVGNALDRLRKEYELLAASVTS